MIAVIDYNVGNVHSVLNTLKRLGIDATLTRDKSVIKNSDGIILPGVGTFPTAMKNLREFDLIEILNERKCAGVPILGICLGAQIIFEHGFEVRETKGLGYLSGNVRLIDTSAKLPHMGWNNLEFVCPSPFSSVAGMDVYFVHSYMVDFTEDTIAFAEYGGVKIPAIFGKENIVGCQFHPEKSGESGAKILLKWKEYVYK
ncbi:MAG: imidazole glycerol phosphate synthase subunit HisH [Clostridiales bacterium]|jgi:glutamine amidotransferase|nr:imidazole glycerol phosphate synthase subunit HisH [Clostridiales bacterium]